MTFPCVVEQRDVLRHNTQQVGEYNTYGLNRVHWSGVVTYAYFLHTVTEFFILGVVVGIVFSGSQALSRSFYGAMIPEEASAEFYGFYSVLVHIKN